MAPELSDYMVQVLKIHSVSIKLNLQYIKHTLAFCSFLANGYSYQTLADFKLELSHDFCNTLWEVLQLIEKAPPTVSDWNTIENEFCELWNST